MFHDRLIYRPNFNPFFRTLCMRFEGERDGDVDGGGGGSVVHEHWTEKYKSTRDNEYLGRFKTEEEAHIGHIATKSKVGDPMHLPKSMDKATDEQKAEWNTSVGKLRGVPDKAEDYDLKPPKDLPENIKLDEELTKAAKELSKSLHVPQATLQAFHELQLNAVARQMAAHTESNEKAGKECVEKLQEELGKEKCKEALILVERALRSKINPDWHTVKAEDDEAWQDFKTTVYATGVGNNKVVMDLLIVAANMLESTGKLLPGTHSTAESKFSEKGTEGMTEEEIQKAMFPNSPGMLS